MSSAAVRAINRMLSEEIYTQQLTLNRTRGLVLALLSIIYQLLTRSIFLWCPSVSLLPRLRTCCRPTQYQHCDYKRMRKKISSNVLSENISRGTLASRLLERRVGSGSYNSWALKVGGLIADSTVVWHCHYTENEFSLLIIYWITEVYGRLPISAYECFSDDVESTGLSSPRTQQSNYRSESGAVLSSYATAPRAFTTVKRPALQMQQQLGRAHFAQLRMQPCPQATPSFSMLSAEILGVAWGR